jgi:hypothetical protein
LAPAPCGATLATNSSTSRQGATPPSSPSPLPSPSAELWVIVGNRMSCEVTSVWLCQALMT